ncbi:phage integrase family protein [Burkholderia anthina]|uniref:phage integrase family protein n=1 Tax=Burkholderia anthina TaxID=179879 RepID=UPI003C7A805D
MCVKGLPIATIARLFFVTDAAEPLEVELLLRTMRDDLVAQALHHGSSVLVAHLQAAIAKYGEPRLTPMSLQMIEQAAGTWAAAVPAADDPVSRWVRPLVAQWLGGEGVGTLGELVVFCNRRGGSGWRSVPRMGVGRARWSPGCAGTPRRPARRSRSTSSICCWPSRVHVSCRGAASWCRSTACRCSRIWRIRERRQQGEHAKYG